MGICLKGDYIFEAKGLSTESIRHWGLHEEKMASERAIRDPIN